MGPWLTSSPVTPDGGGRVCPPGLRQAGEEGLGREMCGVRAVILFQANDNPGVVQLGDSQAGWAGGKAVSHLEIMKGSICCVIWGRLLNLSEPRFSSSAKWRKYYLVHSRFCGEELL